MTETREARASWLSARFAPATYDEDARTVEVVWSTGADVRRRDWDGEYIERLSMDAGAVDMSRLSNGAPVLNSHDAWSLSSVLGVVERAWIEGGEGRAVLRFSDRAEVQPILRDIRDGILRNISVGYDVMKWEEGKDKDGKRFKRAVRWQPAEISLVPIPADASAQVRAAEMSADDAGDAGDQDHDKEGQMAENAPQVPETPALPTHDVTAEVRAAERARIAEIRSVVTAAARQHLFPQDRLDAFEREAIEAGSTSKDLGARMMEAKLAEPVRPGPTGTIVRMGESGDDPAKIADAMADALAVRAMPGYQAKNERFRDFAGLRPSDMLIELANARGERVSPRDRAKLIERSFHTTSDFPLLLELSGNKMLEAGYALAEPSYRAWMGRRDFADFRAHRFLTAGDFPALAQVNESGEITAGTISEKREIVTPATYARQVRVTRQMLVNDDLGAFIDFASMIGRRVADYENFLAYSLVNTASGDGPTLAEGSAAVFGTAAARLNKSGSSTTISLVALTAGFNAIQTKTSLDGLRLNLRPRYLVCSPAQQFIAAQFANQVAAPDVASKINVFAGSYVVVSDANIPDNRWYLFADAALAPVYVYGYVNGQTAPMIRVQQYVPGTDGIAVEVVHDFGVGAIDYRGGWFNPGAAPT
jgi:phage head maturation protease